MDPTGRNESPNGIGCAREQGTKEIVITRPPIRTSEAEAWGGRVSSSPSIWQKLINYQQRLAEGVVCFSLIKNRIYSNQLWGTGHDSTIQAST